MNFRKMAETVADGWLKSDQLRTRRDYGKEENEDEEDQPLASQIPKGTVASVADRYLGRSAAAAAPRDVGEMLDKAVGAVKNKAKRMDLSDRKQAVQVYGMLFKLLWTWAAGESDVNYANFKSLVGWRPASEGSREWVESANDARHRTVVLKALKKKWPEAHEWMQKHKMKT